MLQVLEGKAVPSSTSSTLSTLSTSDKEPHLALDRMTNCARCSRAPRRFKRRHFDGWRETRGFPISDVWLDSARRPEQTSVRTKLYITLLGSGVGIGALIGSLLTALLGR